MDLNDDEMSEWVMERVYCLERGVQTGESQKRKIDKNLQTANARLFKLIKKSSNFIIWKSCIRKFAFWDLIGQTCRIFKIDFWIDFIDISDTWEEG